MRPYRAAEEQPAPNPPPTTYSYATELDADRKRVVLNTLKIVLFFACPLALVPRRWLSMLDPTLFLVGTLMLLLVAAVLAVRYAQSNATCDIEAYEECLLGAQKRKNERRRRALKRRGRSHRH